MFFESGQIAECRWERCSEGVSAQSDKEVIERILRELINLFDLSDRKLWVRLWEADTEPIEVKTELSLEGAEAEFVGLRGRGEADERDKAAVHRLFKVQLYRLMRQTLNLAAAPWGILHGVRPTKIVHRWIDAGANSADVVGRLARDYEVSASKAELLAEVAFRQRPFLSDNDEKTVAVYVGIPFCLSRCLYCSFPAYVLPGADRLREFWRVWRQDLLAAVAEINRYGFKVQSVYMGGGTPTALPDDFFAEALALVHESFVRTETKEFTVEAGRPDSLSTAKIGAMGKLGVTRISVNPQTMQAATLQRIGRRHSPEDILTAYRNLRREGDWQINMDVILGLPGETAEDVADTMTKIMTLSPDDITLHALALKKGSCLKLALDKKSQSSAELAVAQAAGGLSLPSDEETRRMSETALDFIYREGFSPYYLYRQGYMRGQLENIGCARPGKESIYNIQIMEERQTIMGIGCAAVTKVVDRRAGRLQSVFNAKDLSVYLRDIDTYTKKRANLLREVYG